MRCSSAPPAAGSGWPRPAGCGYAHTLARRWPLAESNGSFNEGLLLSNEEHIMMAYGLKILPSSHSTATWCIIVNVSMWCLPTTAHKEWCARYYYRNDKETYTFHRQNPFILQHDVHTNIP